MKTRKYQKKNKLELQMISLDNLFMDVKQIGNWAEVICKDKNSLQVFGKADFHNFPKLLIFLFILLVPFADCKTIIINKA
jgi:hypothetical protein